MSNICVIGLGFVGLPAAIMFANNGHTVHGVDIDESIIDAVMRGEAGGDEPRLTDLLQHALDVGNFRASASTSVADAFVIAVPTPVRGDRTPDMTFVINACRSIVDHLKPGDLVVVESTIPPGATANEITATLQEGGLKAGTDFSLAYCPERVLPGNIVKEIVENDRIIGGIDERSTKSAVDLYGSVVTGNLRESDAATAEMVKLAENTYRDVNIALANSLANMSETTGVNIWNVVEMANLHPRVNIHQPGPGVGGHCIPVDPWFLVNADESSSKLIRLAREVNDGQPRIMANLAIEALTGIQRANAALLGASYKPDVKDARESPTADLSAHLTNAGITVSVADPHVTEFVPAIVPLYDAIQDADIIIVVVKHEEYLQIHPQAIAGLMRTRTVLDTTNALDRDKWESSGFTFLRYGEGRKTC